MFSPINMITTFEQYIAGYTMDYLRKFQVIDNTPQQVLSGYMDTFLGVTMGAHYTMREYIEGSVHPVLEEITDASTYMHSNFVLPAATYTLDSMFALISISEHYLADFSKIQLFCILLLFFLMFGMQRSILLTRNHKKDVKVYRSLLRHSMWEKDTLSDEMKEVTRRLKRNKVNRMPKTISRIENLYKLMDRNFDNQTRLWDEINYWCPVIMAQETKLRIANKAHADNGEHGRVGKIRDLGSHVDMNLMRIKDTLDVMAAGVKREMGITANLYDS
ncbi:uncharacterized protein LOC134723060 [Mytilus trossulus]|uniref:uncharacterized protein LOC134723060 n=1 Tax=Mytilus trossulus TaxID=6551 RepID=UPI0030065635